MKKFFLTLISSLILSFPTFSIADTIIDTGKPSFVYSAVSLEANQWVAAQFSIDQLWTLTSIEVFLWSDRRGSSSIITMAIYGDDNGLVDESNRPYSKEFKAVSDEYADWYGLTDISWNLPKIGKYWIGLEIQPDDYGGGWVYGANQSSLIVAGRYNGTPYSGDGLYEKNPNYRTVGLIIKADHYEPIPEPSTTILLGLGLIFAMGINRKKICL